MVKLTKTSNVPSRLKSSASSKQIAQTAAERVANKILVGPIHKIPKPEPKLPPLKYGIQHSERILAEDLKPFYPKRPMLSSSFESIRDISIIPNLIINRALVSQVSVNQGEFILEEAIEEQVDEIDEEITSIMKDIALPIQAQIEHRLTPNLLSDIKEVFSTQIQSKLAPSPKPTTSANPFITPKLANISVKPPDVINKEETMATPLINTDVMKVQQPVPVKVEIQSHPEPLRVEKIEPKPSEVKKKEPQQGATNKKVKKEKKEKAKPMPDLIKSTQQSGMTTEEVMSEMIQTNQPIPKELLREIITENKDLPSEVIVEIPMVKAAIEYNFKVSFISILYFCISS